jgi:tRNA U34 5-carboxymethylaminomethyl modifying GTPase MnmE/TrmE
MIRSFVLAICLSVLFGVWPVKAQTEINIGLVISLSGVCAQDGAGVRLKSEIEQAAIETSKTSSTDRKAKLIVLDGSCNTQIEFDNISRIVNQERGAFVIVTTRRGPVQHLVQQLNQLNTPHAVIDYSDFGTASKLARAAIHAWVDTERRLQQSASSQSKKELFERLYDQYQKR